MKTKCLCALAFLVLGTAAGPRAEPAPTAGSVEAAQLSEIMARELSSLLDQLLGPGRAKAYVHVEGSSTEENKQSETVTPKSKEGDPALNPPPPGFPYPFQYLTREQQQSRKLTGFRIQRLSVSILVDTGIPQEKINSMRRVVEDMLKLETERGDSLTIVRAEFFPVWKSMLATPGVLQSAVGQVGAIVGLLFASFVAYLLGMGVVRRLGSALAGRPAAQPQVITVGAPAAAPGLPGQGPGAPSGGSKGPAEAEGKRPGGPVVIDVSLEQLPRLAHLLKDQSPQNVALVMPHLRPEVRKAYLESAPKDFAADVMLAMAPVRYVDPDLLSQLKEELERRVRGVVGGPEQAAEMIRSLAGGERSSMMERLRERSPEAAAAIRGRLLLFEDLARFDADALAEIAAAVGAERLAAASARSPEPLREALAGALPGRAAEVYREAVELARGAPDSARESAAQEAVLKKLEELLSSGRVKRPGPAPGGDSAWEARGSVALEGPEA